MVRPARWLPTLLAVTLTATLAAALPAAAAPPEPAAAPAGPVQVTLITGDVVELATAGPDRYAATVRPAPGRESITFHTTEDDGRMLVLPSDVIPYLSAGVLDERLFDVPELVAQGYHGATASRLIVRYAGPASAEVGTLAQVAPTAARLDSIGAAVLTPEPAALRDVWAALTGPAAADRFGAGIAEVWLDGRVTPVLDRSVGQIGAPAAWAAGFDGTGVDIAVLDTGVDDTHPDLAGKVTAVRNFTDSPAVTDGFGHGTHVAATAAGTGAAGRSGVAPGANLLSGKVLNDHGIGFDSWIIAGMEWAIAEGAEIVNLSLGGGRSDGTDPLSEAVNQLSAESGTLFVISAGNDGADYAVSTPGAATAALTVGAVDRDERLAEFSSRGPRLGDGAIKPEITGPGVGIVAARAAGTALGRPVDADYTAASGTSMAAPHVAGTAALLAQAHPNLTGPQLKDALVSTAEPNPELGFFGQGGGRVDAAGAVGTPVLASGTLNLGLHREGDADPKPATIAYTNPTGAAVTLDLTAELSNLEQLGDASDAVTLGTDRMTVPAGATVTVPVALDLDRLERGRHAGRITATGPDGAVARTAVTAVLTGPTHSVTFRAVAADGSPAGIELISLRGLDRRADRTDGWIRAGDSVTFEVEEGTYLLHVLIMDFDRQFEQAHVITDPHFEITGEQDEIVLDAGTTVPVEIQTPKPSEQRAIYSHYVHRVMGNGRAVSHGAMHFSVTRQLNVTPTDPVSTGEYEFSSRWQLVAPMVDAQVQGVTGPLDINLLHQSPTFDDRRRFRLVWAGTGTPAELAAAGVRGAAVVVTGDEQRPEEEQIAAATGAGAAAVLIVRAADFPPWTVWRPNGDREPIPAMVVGHDDGQRIIERIRERSGRLSLKLTVDSPYLYDVFHVETGRVPDRIVHRVTPANSARFQVGYADLGGFDWLKEQRFGWRPWQTFSWNDYQRFLQAGQTREEWVSAGDSLWQHRVQHEYTWDDLNPLLGGMTEAPRSYRPGKAEPVTWFGPVVRPAPATGVPWLTSARTGDVLALRVPEFSDSGDGHFLPADEFWDQPQVRLLRDGELLATLPDGRRDVLVGPEPAGYRLELAVDRETEEWRWSTRTETAWEFRSGHTTGAEPLPLLQVDYHVPADLHGEVTGWLPHLLRLSLRDTTGPADLREAGLDVSFDDGANWRPVPAVRVGHQLLALMPPGEGPVSLRVHAADTDGNAVSQTVLRAYGLR